MNKEKSCYILERYAHQIAEMSVDELRKKWHDSENEERKRIHAKRINLDDAFLFVPPEREKKD